MLGCIQSASLFCELGGATPALAIHKRRRVILVGVEPYYGYQGQKCGAPMGLMNRSYFGGFLVKPGPTKVALVTIRFHCFFCRLPDRITLNISSSATGRTCRMMCSPSSISSLVHLWLTTELIVSKPALLKTTEFPAVTKSRYSTEVPSD